MVLAKQLDLGLSKLVFHSSAVMLMALGAGLSFGVLSSSARPVPDNTLGTESSSIRSVSDIRDLIEGGAIRGNNLFHSFREFNIDEGQEAYFANPAAIENILSRVTGDDPSNIFGTLGVLGGANLFFINPNGIIFGPNSQLDIRGSFVASTADRFTFPDGSSFSSVNPEAPPLLTMSITPGLQYGAHQPAPLVNAGNLTVGQGQSLTLTGGTVVSTGELTAPGGNVSVAAVPSNSLVQLGEAGELLTWSVLPSLFSEMQPDSSTLSVTEMLDMAGINRSNLPADILPGTTLVSGLVDVSDVEQVGGSVQILGERVGLLDADINASGLLGGGTALIGGNYQGQGPLPNAIRTYVDSASSLNVDALQHGDGGQAVIWADGRTDFYGEVTARGGLETGNGGLVEISGRDTLLYEGTVDTSALNGEFGKVLFDPFNITIINRGDGNDDGEIGNGDETINRFDGFNGVFFQNFIISENRLEGLDDANANVVLQAINDITIEDLDDNELRFEDGPSGSITFDAGGNFSMHPSDTIRALQRDVNIFGASLSIGSIDVAVPLGGEGKAGNINLEARTGDILIRGFFNGSEVFFDNSEPPNPRPFLPIMLNTYVSVGVDGDAGDVTLTAEGDIRFDGDFDQRDVINSVMAEDGDPNRVEFREPVAVSAFVSTPIEDENGDLIGGNGDGGAITITSRNGAITNNLEVIDRNGISRSNVAGIINSTTPSGTGGTIELRANGNIDVGDVESFVGVPIGNGNGGPITIVSDRGSVDTTSGQVVSSTPNGTGGVITIIASGDINSERIESVSSDGGNGGRVTLNAGRNLSAGVINSYAFNGIGGIVDIDIDNGNITNIDSINTGPFIGNEFTGAVDIDITNGNITDIGSINTSFAGGNSGLVNIDVGGSINDIGSINTNSASGNDASVLLNASGDITINSINTGDGLLSVVGNTIVQQSGSISVDGNATFESRRAETGNVIISNNLFEVQTNACASGTGTCLGESIIGGNFNLFSNGEVAQASNEFLQVAGEVRVNNILNLDLENSNNIVPLVVEVVGDNLDITVAEVGQVDAATVVNNALNEARNNNPGSNPVVDNLTINSLSTGLREFRSVYDANGDAINLSGNNRFGGVLSLTTDADTPFTPTGTPEIIQSGPIQVNGATSFNASSSGNIVLDDPDNQITDIGFFGNDVVINSIDEINLTIARDVRDEPINPAAVGNLSLTSGGAITQESLLTVGGDAQFTTSLADSGSVAFNNTTNVVLDNSAIGGNLTLASGGTVTQAPDSILRVAGDVDIDAPGDIDLTSSRNTIPPLVLPNGDVVITQVGLIDLSAQTVSGDLTVNSVATGERFLDVFTPSAIALNNPENSIQGSVSFNTALPGTEAISGIPEITQSGTQLVNGTATFNALTGNITLADALNQFENVAFNGNNISLREDGSMNLLSSQATGSVNVVADEAITQAGGLDIQGRTQLETLLRNGFIRLDDPGNALVGRIQLITQEAGSVDVQNILATQLASSDVGDDLTIISGGDITQTGRLIVTGVTSLDAGSNNIILDSPDNDFEVIAIRGARDAILRDSNSVTLSLADIGQNFTVTADEQITTRRRAAVAAGGRQRGDLIFNAPSIVLRNGSIVANQTTDNRPGGNIFINASETLRLQGSVLLANINATDPNQQSGNIFIDTEELVLRDGAIISSSVLENGQGSGGDLIITADVLDIRDVGLLNLETAINTFRDIGFVINEPSIQASPSRLAATTNEVGNAGNILVNVRELILQNGGIIATATARGSVGRGGNLTINASDEIILSGTQDTTDLFSQGENLEQNVDVFQNQADDNLPSSTFIPSLIATDTLGDGRAGNLVINTGQLTVRDGAAISSSTSSRNPEAVGGQATIIASDGILLEGTAPNGFSSGLYAQSFADARAGDMTIQIRDGDLVLRDNARVTVASGSASDARLPIGLPPFTSRNTVATGNAGELTIEASSIFMSDDSSITAETASGEGGNITVSVDDIIFLENNSDIRTVAGGTGNGGNIALNAGVAILAQLPEDSDVIANAFEGNGGNIFASAPLILGFRQFDGVDTSESDFVASSELGLDGNVNFDTNDPPEPEDPPIDFVVPEVNQGCLTSRRSRAARFRDLGRGGLSINPYEPLSNSGLVDDIRLPRYLDSSSSDIENANDAVDAIDQIIEAHYWSTDEAGNTILIADNIPVSESDRSTEQVNHCQIH